MWLRYGFGYSWEYSHCVCGCRSGAFRNRLNSDGATSGTGWVTGGAGTTAGGWCDRGDTAVTAAATIWGGSWATGCAGGGGRNVGGGGGGDGGVLAARRTRWSSSVARRLFLSCSSPTTPPLPLLLLLSFWLIAAAADVATAVGDKRSAATGPIALFSDRLSRCRLWWWWWWWWWCRLCAPLPDTVVNKPLWPLIPVLWLLVVVLSTLTLTLIGPNGSDAVLPLLLLPSAKRTVYFLSHSDKTLVGRYLFGISEYFINTK